MLCRASRYSGVRYGLSYERIEDTELTVWYRKTLDPGHGREGQSAHDWQPSACPVYAAPGVGNLDAACPNIAPIFLLKPETELAALEDASDNRTRKALIKSLGVPDRALALERVKLVVEYAYVHREKLSWSSWWRRNSQHFGLSVSARPIARK